jgi:uncharacterized protein
MRNLLLFLLILIGVYYLRRMLAGESAADKTSAAPQPETQREAERVLPCAHCGLLVPASEGVEAHGLFFCSPEHQSLGPAKE